MDTKADKIADKICANTQFKKSNMPNPFLRFATLLDRVKSLKLGFYGHTTRKYESLEKEIVQGCVPGYRNRQTLVDNAGVGQMTSPNGLG